jgi:hypothetical protein
LKVKINPIVQIFTGITGGISSKRTIMFLSFIMMIIMAGLSTFYGCDVKQFIFEGFLYIVVGSLFSVASEHFGSSFKKVPIDEYYESNLDDEKNRRDK